MCQFQLSIKICPHVTTSFLFLSAFSFHGRLSKKENKELPKMAFKCKTFLDCFDNNVGYACIHTIFITTFFLFSFLPSKTTLLIILSTLLKIKWGECACFVKKEKKSNKMCTFFRKLNVQQTSFVMSTNFLLIRNQSVYDGQHACIPLCS